MATMRTYTARDGTTSYQVLFRDGGKQRSKTFASSKAADIFSDKVRVLGPKRALAEADIIDGPTLDEIAERFFAHKANRVRSERTVSDYRRDYKNWIQHPLGWQVAATVDEQDVQDWVDAMRGKLAPKSIGDRHALLHGVFKFAGAPTRRLIPSGHNPCVGTDLPKKVKAAPKGLRMAEWQALYIALRQINVDAADLAEFLVASGWRWSEATALSTLDVEDDGKYVHVSMSQVARRQSDGSTLIVEDAKSTAGRRRLRLDPDASDMVRRRVRSLRAGELVFTTEQGSPWNYSHFRSRFWRKAIDVAQLQRQPTIHWLRHTNVGLLDAAGVSLAEIQRRIGHESITTTIDVYGGMIDDIKDEALDAIAAMRSTGLPELTALD